MATENREQPKSQTAVTTPKTELASSKDLITKADGNLSVSEKEAIAIKFLDSKAYSKLSAEEKARWVNEIIDVLKRFNIEKKEIQAFCEIAIKKIKGEVTSGSELFNDLADIGRNHCATLKRTGYFPTEASDIKMVAGYFRHISKDAGQRQKYITYLNANPAEKELFTKYITDSDNLVNYFLKNNKEERVVRSVELLVTEMSTALSAQIKGSLVQEITKKNKNNSEVFGLFGKFENISPADFAAFENQTITNPGLAVEFMETWDTDSSAKKALLKDKPKLHERLEALFLKLSKKHEVHSIDKKNKQEILDRINLQASKEKMATEAIKVARNRISTKSTDLFVALREHSLINSKTDQVKSLQAEIRAIADDSALKDAAKNSPEGSENRKQIEAIYHAINTLAYKLETRSSQNKNYTSELKAKQDIVEAAITRGEIMINTFLAEKENDAMNAEKVEKGNIAMNVEKIESDIRNNDIKDINSVGFAGYIQSLYSTGKLNYEYLNRNDNIGHKKLAEIALHWGINDSLKDKSSDKQTLAQKALKDTNKHAFDLFKDILTATLKARSEAIKFDENKGYPEIAAYLKSSAHQPPFTLKEIDETLGRLNHQSILPLLIEITGKKGWSKDEILNFVSYLEHDRKGVKHNAEADLSRENLHMTDTIAKFKLHGIRFTQSERKFLQSIETQEIRKIDEKDWQKLSKILNTLAESDPKLAKKLELINKIRSTTLNLADATTIKSSKVTQEKIAVAGAQTRAEAKKRGVAPDTTGYSEIAAKNGKQVQKILDESRSTAVDAIHAADDILAQLKKPLPANEKPITDWLEKLGFGKYSMEEILRSESLRYAVLMRIGKMNEPIPTEVRAFQMKLAELVKADLARRTADATINEYHADNGVWMQSSIAQGSITASTVAANDVRV